MKTVKSLFKPLVCTLAFAGMTATATAADGKKDIVGTAGVKCSNGTIHIIDAVLMPPAAK